MKRIAITLGVLSILSAAHAQEATKPATDSANTSSRDTGYQKSGGSSCRG